MLDQLPESQRQPINLIALKELSYAEAAHVIDAPLGTFTVVLTGTHRTPPDHRGPGNLRDPSWLFVWRKE
jgi:hypothetical protein